MKITCGSVISLYRGYLRETRRLPHTYLQLFFRLKVANDVRAMLRADKSQGVKFNRIYKELRKVHDANNGNHKAFARILDIAYGRKGKLRWEIMQPLLSYPQALVPPRIIPAVEKSRPPIYSSELKALLTSARSRTTKPLSPQALDLPPLMPARANPSSEEARLLGRLSKRREVNVRWRYFTTEWKKIQPPLEVAVKDTSHDQGSHLMRRPADVGHMGIRSFGFQGYGVFEQVESLAGPSRVQMPLTKREQSQGTILVSSPPRHPVRWLRRRYRELLSRLPILIYSQPKGDVGTYSVSLSANSLSSSLRQTTGRLAEVDPGDLAWLGQAK